MPDAFPAALAIRYNYAGIWDGPLLQDLPDFNVGVLFNGSISSEFYVRPDYYDDYDFNRGIKAVQSNFHKLNEAEDMIMFEEKRKTSKIKQAGEYLVEIFAQYRCYYFISR